MKTFTVIFFILIALTLSNPGETTPMDLTQFQWKNRLLFLFAPDSNHPFYKHLQSQIMEQKSEVEDRDMVVFSVLAQGPSQMNTTAINHQQADSIRDRFVIPPNAFSLILIGKDGGIKLKRNDPVDLAEVFELIDSMPMRRNEMQQKNQLTCPDSPNCVSSLGTDKAHFVEPLHYAGSLADAKQRLINILQNTKRVRMTKIETDYIHAEFRSVVFQFVDDVEFFFPAEKTIIHIKSASRTGYYDFGANRRRVERLRTAFGNSGK